MTDRTVTDVVCTRCGCLCDDLRVKVSGDAVDSVSMGGTDCGLAQSWFLAQSGSLLPEYRCDGRPVDAEAAIQAAATILTDSVAPLVLGLVECSVDGQRAAVALADKIGARLHVPSSAARSASIAALQVVGASTSTLGEVQHRADLIIYWGCDPTTTHPRHLERFASTSKLKRHVVSIGRDASMCSFADESIAVSSNEVVGFANLLRTFNRGVRREPGAGSNVDAAEALVERMQNSNYGVIFYGDEVAASEDAIHVVQSIHRLVTELNAHARFTVRYMSGPGNATGAANVLAWQTGYPPPVEFAAGYPLYCPAQNVVELLDTSDAVVLVGLDSLALLPEEARGLLTKKKVVALMHGDSDAGFQPTVLVRTAKPGVHVAGTAYRMDEVPLPLKQIFPAAVPTDEEVLLSIAKRTRMAGAAGGTKS